LTFAILFDSCIDSFIVQMSA